MSERTPAEEELMELLGQHGFARSMTPRARWYLIIAAIRHTLIGGFAVFAAGSFQSPSFGPIISAAPLPAWGTMFLFVAVGLILGAWFKSARIARFGLMGSAATTFMVGIGLLLAYFTGDLTSPTGPIIWLAVAGKDFTVCADPLRSPFEDWVEEIITGEELA
jgi:hypothetical protein